MKRVVAALVVLTAALGLTVFASAAHAQPSRSQPGAQSTEQARDQAQASEKLALARQMLQAREDLQRRGPLAPAFWSYWTERLTNLSLSQLQGIAALGLDAGLEEQIALVTGSVRADNSIESLGDSSKDLVYTKVSPCRIVDTRSAGGALGTGTSRSFYVAGGSMQSQGGTVAGCGIPLGPATAVAMNITVVGASGYGWLRAYPYGGSGNASVINYNTGDTIANGLVMPICDVASAVCDYDLTVVADTYGGHVLIDVMGYWAKVNRADFRSTVTMADSQAEAVFPGTTGCTSYLLVSVVTTGPGVIVVEGNADLSLAHTAGATSAANLFVSTSPTDCSGSYGRSASSLWIGPQEATGTYLRQGREVSLNRMYSQAGTYMFYLNYQRAAGTGQFATSNGGLTATFHPQ